MFEDYNSRIMPSATLPASNDRSGQSAPALKLPPKTVVMSADNHIELSDDIWFERFPARLKDKAPRVWRGNDGVTNIGIGGKTLLPDAFAEVFRTFGFLPGGNSNDMAARLADLDAEGIDKELAFPNAVLALLGYPDLEVRETCYRIYNEYIAELQERSGGRFHGVGLINWWDAQGTRRTLAELKALGLKTFLMPLNPGLDAAGERIDLASRRMTPVWDEIEASGVPVSHHIGEFISQPCEFNMMLISFVHSAAPFRDLFARYIFGGILDRHPGLRIGWFEGGINWVVSAIQDAEHALASFAHMQNLAIEHPPEFYWRRNMYASFIVDPLGLEMIDRIGRDRVMWSSDYPHNESSFGYSRSSINLLADVLGPDAAVAAVGGNIMGFLGI